MEELQFDGRLRVNTERFIANHEVLLTRINENQAKINERSGFHVRVGSNKDLHQLFCNQLGLKPLRMSPKSDTPSYAKDVILSMRAFATPEVREICDSVIELKELQAKEKYFRIAGESLKEGYISYELQQEAVSGRVYAKAPNVMSFPAEIRECVIPETGNMFIGADFNQQELCLIAIKLGCNGILEDVAGRVDIFQYVADSTKLPRDEVKLATYAYFYGASMRSIASKIMRTEAEAAKIIEGLFGRYPELQGWNKYVEQVRAQGYADTMLEGRRYSIDTSNVDLEEEIRRAVNFAIQGTGGEILRRLIYQLQKADLKVIVFVHDSVVVEVPEAHVNEVSGMLSQLMNGFMHGQLVAEVKIGKTWREVWE